MRHMSLFWGLLRVWSNRYDIKGGIIGEMRRGSLALGGIQYSYDMLHTWRNGTI